MVKMKILVICQYYYPEPMRITDICEELVKRGNEVTVVTGIPNYPMGNVYKGYENGKRRFEVINGVSVHRCFTIPRKSNAIMRFLNYHSFSYFSKKYIKNLDDNYDVVLVNQLSPVMMANAAIKYKKIYNKKIVMYCLDIWPESLCVGNIKKDSLLYKIYYEISKKIYKNMDRILVTSRSFVEYLSNSFNIEKDKIEYLPQYSELLFDKDKCKKVDDSNIDLLFAGNIGKAQNIDTIIAAADILKNNKNLFFHIVGDGQELDRLKSKVKKMRLKNVIFYGRKSLEEMPNYYRKADAMIVTLCGDFSISSTLPGKVQTYMSAGKPIIGSADGETKFIVEDAKCGFCSKAGDGQELAKNIKRFINLKNKNILGENSYKYYKEKFDKDKFFDKLLSELRKGAN